MLLASRDRHVALLAVLLAISLGGRAMAQTASTRATDGPRRTGSISGRVIHPEGAAAEGARVAVYAVREGAAAAIVAFATSAYDGRYEVTGLPPGEFMVGVTPRKASGFGGDLKRKPAAIVETFYPGVADRDRAEPITVFESVPVEGVDVWLAPAPRRFSISGRIFWPDGLQAEDLVIEYGGADGLRHGIWYVHDPGGLFTIEGAAQGTYVLIARGRTASGPLIGIASTNVAIGPVEDVRVQLRAPGVIEGRVVIDGPGGVALDTLSVVPVQMLIKLSPLYPVKDAAVASDGRFIVDEAVGEYSWEIRGLPDGWRIKRVGRSGTASTGRSTVVPAGARVTGFEIVVGPGTT
jgi:hypothetical protein